MILDILVLWRRKRRFVGAARRHARVVRLPFGRHQVAVFALRRRVGRGEENAEMAGHAIGHKVGLSKAAGRWRKNVARNRSRIREMWKLPDCATYRKRRCWAIFPSPTLADRFAHERARVRQVCRRRRGSGRMSAGIGAGGRAKLSPGLRGPIRTSAIFCSFRRIEAMPGSGDARRVVAGDPRTHLYQIILLLTLTQDKFLMSQEIPCARGAKFPVRCAKNSLPVIRKMARK